MLSFPNAKINIGLNVLSKRIDGYHNIETLFYPLPLHDILEIVPSKENTKLKLYGESPEIPMHKNLVYKAWKIMHENHNIPSVKINLYKKIPSGAGLGGGSSDAAYCLVNLNKQFDLNLTDEELKDYALKLGSDCPFFIENKPAFAEGRGEILKKSNINLKGKYLMLCLPDIEINTGEAYKNTKASEKSIDIKQIHLNKPHTWRKLLHNSFEAYVFEKHPEIKSIKENLIKQGAEYALLSGSGSAVYGIFNNEIPEIKSRDNYITKVFVL